VAPAQLQVQQHLLAELVPLVEALQVQQRLLAELVPPVQAPQVQQRLLAEQVPAAPAPAAWLLALRRSLEQRHPLREPAVQLGPAAASPEP
jgi:hypothetical protein